MQLQVLEDTSRRFRLVALCQAANRCCCSVQQATAVMYQLSLKAGLCAPAKPLGAGHMHTLLPVPSATLTALHSNDCTLDFGLPGGGGGGLVILDRTLLARDQQGQVNFDCCWCSDARRQLFNDSAKLKGTVDLRRIHLKAGDASEGFVPSRKFLAAKRSTG